MVALCSSNPTSLALVWHQPHQRRVAETNFVVGSTEACHLIDRRFFPPIANEYPLFLSKEFQRKLSKRLDLPRSKKTGCFSIRETITQFALCNMRLKKTRVVHALPAEIIVIVFDHLVNMYQEALF